MILQTRFQNRKNLRETIWLGQAEFGNAEWSRASEWANEMFEQRKDECPEGWVPLICNQDSEHFVFAAPPSNF